MSPYSKYTIDDYSITVFLDKNVQNWPYYAQNVPCGILFNTDMVKDLRKMLFELPHFESSFYFKIGMKFTLGFSLSERKNEQDIMYWKSFNYCSIYVAKPSRLF